MESKEPAVFVSTYKEGVERVLEGETVLASTLFVKTDLEKLFGPLPVIGLNISAPNLLINGAKRNNYLTT